MEQVYCFNYKFCFENMQVEIKGVTTKRVT